MDRVANDIKQKNTNEDIDKNQSLDDLRKLSVEIIPKTQKISKKTQKQKVFTDKIKNETQQNANRKLSLPSNCLLLSNISEEMNSQNNDAISKEDECYITSDYEAKNFSLGNDEINQQFTPSVRSPVRFSQVKESDELDIDGSFSFNGKEELIDNNNVFKIPKRKGSDFLISNDLKDIKLGFTNPNTDYIKPVKAFSKLNKIDEIFELDSEVIEETDKMPNNDFDFTTNRCKKNSLDESEFDCGGWLEKPQEYGVLTFDDFDQCCSPTMPNRFG